MNRPQSLRVVPAHHPMPFRPRTAGRRQSDQGSIDEISGGNAGSENDTTATDGSTAAERAEYRLGWRTGVGTGFVGGLLAGGLGACVAAWAGVAAWVRLL